MARIEGALAGVVCLKGGREAGNVERLGIREEFSSDGKHLPNRSAHR